MSSDPRTGVLRRHLETRHWGCMYRQYPCEDARRGPLKAKGRSLERAAEHQGQKLQTEANL